MHYRFNRKHATQWLRDAAGNDEERKLVEAIIETFTPMKVEPDDTDIHRVMKEIHKLAISLSAPSQVEDFHQGEAAAYDEALHAMKRALTRLDALQLEAREAVIGA